ncbi:glucoamylase family protein [uncultured Bacteroides sp.]|uniref:glucoamylase family protein n=1 Tax=uncultured Bacteroides sp. TaxID=162156 RepID=UPI0025F976B2|nr:glucoamylase family protein [uncultured Bacteroides sp.]
MKKYLSFTHILFIVIALLTSCSDDNETVTTDFRLTAISIGEQQNLSAFTNVAPDASIVLQFSDAADESTVARNIRFIELDGEDEFELKVSYQMDADNKKLTITPVNSLSNYSTYKFVVYPGIKSAAGEPIFTGKVYSIKTGMEDSDKFDRIDDEELLTLVQRQTFNYFWDFGHPDCGMARERSTSTATVATGGTGFGVMSTIVAAERNFISREAALGRIQKIVDFLGRCESYHGAYSHWIYGDSGYIQPFSDTDDGVDLLETSLLFQGLLTARAYFKNDNEAEKKLCADITTLWEAIDWNWFRKESSENVLYWHWSRNHGWEMGLKISGWNEGLIAYVLAASSPTNAIDKVVYDEGWANNGGMKNGKVYYDYVLPLGTDNGGPLFLSQYSFLGINPKGLSDAYANYEEQTRNHALINYNYCVDNPRDYAGYGENCWGLTASDGDNGYSAHSPNNDNGVIAPTAALTSFPFTPEESMKALHFFYYKLGDKIWGKYGFVDAFNLSKQWFDKEFIAINQGPIICMIENYRSGLLWELFMSDPDIQKGMKKLGFSSPDLQ